MLGYRNPYPTHYDSVPFHKGSQRPNFEKFNGINGSPHEHFDDDDVQGIFDELMAARAISLPEPKRPTKVNKTNDPRYCLYHKIISHPIKDCYVFKDIIEDMIKRGEIEIEEAPLKGRTGSSNTTSMIEQKDDSYLSSSDTNCLLYTSPSPRD